MLDPRDDAVTPFPAMRLNGSLVLVGAVLLCACGRDFSSVERDAGMWVDRPFDAGRPGPRDPVVCVGTPTSCEARTGDQCDFGCVSGFCGGTPSPCHATASPGQCNEREGCGWFRERYYDECNGAPAPCSRHSQDVTACRENGCTWMNAPCAGAPYECEALSFGNCVVAPGCRVLNPPDAGPPDAGPPPAWCEVVGACDPFAADPCGSGRNCVADDFSGTRCVVEPYSARGIGEACGSASACEEGLDCVDLGSGLRCWRQCRAGSVRTCGEDSRCVVAGIDRGGCIDYCSYVGPPCDVVRQNCSAGFGCYVFHDADLDAPSTLCARTGSLPLGASCVFVNECAQGASCLDGRCREMCNTTADCSVGACTATLEGSTLRSCR